MKLLRRTFISSLPTVPFVSLILPKKPTTRKEYMDQFTQLLWEEFGCSRCGKKHGEKHKYSSPSWQWCEGCYPRGGTA